MTDFLSSYQSLSSSSSREELRDVLQSIVDAPPFAIDSTARCYLVRALLSDLEKCNSNMKTSGKLTSKDVPQALTTLKALGKTPATSEIISEPSNLSLLLSFSTSLKDDREAMNEALRTIANALLLVDTARVNWLRKEVGGGEATVVLLEKSAAPEQIFLASRILFLSSMSMPSSGQFIRALVENKSLCSSGNIVNVIGIKTDALITSILAGQRMSREAMTDLLKFTFNILLHYPKLVETESQDTNDKSGRLSDNKVMGDFWDHRLDGILPPLLRVFNALPPSFPGPLAPPLTHVIHALITVPVSDSLRNVWFGPGSPSRSRQSSSNQSSSNTSPISTSRPLFPGSSSRSGSPTSGSKDGKPGAVDRALSVLAAGRRSLSRSSSPHPPSPAVDVLLRAYDLLDVSLNHYMPDAIDPDDISVREKCKKESENSLDDLVVPVVVLITRLCLSDGASRSRLREWLFPADLDRTRALEGRADLLGRCLRLLGSVYHARLKDAVGEMLFAACDSNPTSLSTQVGYGNVAGFLFNKGIMSAPPAPEASNASSVGPDGTEINPITGTVHEKRELPEMSDEEKEREAEKLFVLFDRLEKSGSLPPDQNPIRKAIQQGKLG